jgi:hypothetical protein
VRVEIKVVSVVITFLSVKIRMRVEITFVSVIFKRIDVKMTRVSKITFCVRKLVKSQSCA